MQKHVATAVADMAATCSMTGSNSTFTASLWPLHPRHANGEDTQQGNSYSISPAVQSSRVATPSRGQSSKFAFMYECSPKAGHAVHSSGHSTAAKTTAPHP